MGRGRQKAKQTKIARKLKYLTTDTNYEELAKELRDQEPGTGTYDPLAEADGGTRHHGSSHHSARKAHDAAASHTDDDLSDYAAWAAKAAARATAGYHASAHVHAAHKPIPMPVPSALRSRTIAAQKAVATSRMTGDPAPAAGKQPSAGNAGGRAKRR